MTILIKYSNMNILLIKNQRNFTNRAELPQAIVDAVKNDSYSKGEADISVTELLLLPRLAALREKHANEIVEDESDRIWSLFGQAMHTVLERVNRVAIGLKKAHPGNGRLESLRGYGRLGR